MIYKVFYQDNAQEVPVRENTLAMYIEANSEREVRQQLTNKNITIEFISAVTEKQLDYERKNPNFKVENE